MNKSTLSTEPLEIPQNTSGPNSIHWTKYPDDVPVEGRPYFCAPETGGKKPILVIVPCFNEKWQAVTNTISSIHDQTNLGDYMPVFLVVQDGWTKADPDMKQNLMQLFPGTHWDNLNANAEQAPVTYIFQNKRTSGDPKVLKCGECEIPVADKMLSVNITLIVKADNRKKHNSHQWGLSPYGFCAVVKPEFFLATDCATLFHPECLSCMIQTMKEEPRCAVCTGKQCAMTAEQQGCKDNTTEKLLRGAQVYDFESSFACFMGAFACAKFLPVVPGPCGLYRWEYMNGEPLRWYFEIVNTASEDCGLIQGNLKIAEDRILTYSILLAREEYFMCLCPSAEFYFEAETSLKKLAMQRRRWSNGSFAGYIFLLQNHSLIWKSKLSWWRKITVFLLVGCQFMVYLIMTITPAVFLSAAYSVLFWVFSPEHYQTTMPTVIWMGYVAFYIWFFVKHFNETFIAWSFYTHLFLSMITMVLTVIRAFAFLATQWGTAPLIETLPLLITAIMMGTPMITASLIPRSLKRAVSSVVQFYLFLPTLIAWFGTYAVARFSDLSWGNRPSGEATTRYASQAHIYGAFVLIANLVCMLAWVEADHSAYFMLAVTLLIYCFASVQIGVSFVFFFTHFWMEKFGVHSLCSNSGRSGYSEIV